MAQKFIGVYPRITNCISTGNMKEYKIKSSEDFGDILFLFKYLQNNAKTKIQTQTPIIPNSM